MPPSVMPGAAAYAARCAGCHGDAAEGNRAGPGLRFAGESGQVVEARVRSAVRDGVPASAGGSWTVRGMPAVPMAQQEEDALVRYLDWLRTAPAAGADSITSSP